VWEGIAALEASSDLVVSPDVKHLLKFLFGEVVIGVEALKSIIR
jgi:hypothetical protein